MPPVTEWLPASNHSVMGGASHIHDHMVACHAGFLGRHGYDLLQAAEGAWNRLTPGVVGRRDRVRWNGEGVPL